MKQNIALFVRILNQKDLSMKVILMMYLNQLILRLFNVYKNLFKNVCVGLLIWS